jgi:hypothetical protein
LASQSRTAGCLWVPCVQHHVEVSARIAAGDELEEGQELGVSMPVKEAAGDLAGDDLQGGEQAGDAVPDVRLDAIS